jgi:hypothetical protein
MVRRLIIHAGMPRAGSSTIQEALYRQRKKLEAAGLLYAALDLKHSSDGKPGQVYNHRQLCESGKGLWRSGRFHILHDEIALAIEASEAPLVVLSYEGWWDPRNHPSLKRTLKSLRTRLPEMDVMIGAVVRDPVNFLLSLYKLDVLHGRTLASFEDYWPRKLRDPRLRYADIGGTFEGFADETRFIRFEDASRDGRFAGNALDAFGADDVFKRAGVGHLGWHRSPGGVFFSDAVITMMRFAAAELGLKRIAEDRERLMKLMHELSQHPDAASQCKSLVITVSARGAAAISAATQQQATAFYHRYLRLDAPDPIVSSNGGIQSSIEAASPLGRLIRAELQKL